MRFIIALAELNKILTKLQNVVSQKPTIPILANLLIEARGNELVFTATDLTVGLRCFTEAKIVEEGATTVPARHFAQLIRELTTPFVEIYTNDQDITHVIAGSSRFTVLGLSKNAYPALPELTDSQQITLPQNLLKNLLYRTAFAVSREDNRYVLTGVFLHLQPGSATFVGTDGKRLSKNTLPLPTGVNLTGEYIIPLKAVDEIMKGLQDEGDATLYLMPDKIAVQAGSSILISKLLSGIYPDYNRIIPESFTKHISLHCGELMTLLRQVSLFTTATSPSVRFSFVPGELRLIATSSDYGEGQVSMPVNYQGEQLDVAFNPGFFIDILRHTKKETLDMGLIDGFSPFVLREEEAAGKKSQSAADYLTLVMPMRIDQPA